MKYKEIEENYQSNVTVACTQLRSRGVGKYGKGYRCNIEHHKYNAEVTCLHINLINGARYNRENTKYKGKHKT